MSTPAPTTPRIMVIRHATKPAKNPPPHGVNPDGDHDKESLTTVGWQRAGALATLFAPSRGPLQSSELATPQLIYASGIGKGSDSERPMETITPTAEKLGLTPNTDFLKGQETAMVESAVAQTGIVLICWEHKAIPGIANQILGNDTTVPQKWPGKRYDMVWVFELDTAGTYSFTQVPQLLLAGDSADPIQ
jgi:broad specificity phosphatase PhoE